MGSYFEATSNLFASMTGLGTSGGGEETMPGCFGKSNRDTVAVERYLTGMVAAASSRRPAVLMMEIGRTPVGFYLTVLLTKSLLLLVFQTMSLISKSRTILTLIRRMNWTAQHIGLGITILCLVGIFFKRLKAGSGKRIASAEASIASAKAKEKNEAEANLQDLKKSDYLLDSPHRVRGVQENVRSSSRKSNKSRHYSYPELRKYRAISTLKPLLLRKSFKKQDIDSRSDASPTLSIVFEQGSKTVNTSTPTISVDESITLADSAERDESSTARDTKCDDQQFVETDEGAAVDVESVQDLQRFKDRLEPRVKSVQEDILLALLNDVSKTLFESEDDIDKASTQLQGNAPAAESKEWSPRKKIIDIINLLSTEDILQENGHAVQSNDLPPPSDAKRCNMMITLDDGQLPDEKAVNDSISQDLQEEKSDALSNTDYQIKSFLENDEKSNDQESELVLENDDRELHLQSCAMTEITKSIIFKHFGAQLRTLNLSSNYLKSLPPQIGDLSGLEFLYLRNNQLQQIPVEFSRLEALQICDFAENQLVQLPNDIFSSCSEQLQILDLSKNNLITLPFSIGNLRSIRTLILGNNQFHDTLNHLVDPLQKAFGTGSPTRGHLCRLQGYLQDLGDLYIAPNESKLITSTRVPATGNLSFSLFQGRDLASAATLTTEKRRKIIQELLETEETYVSQLDDIYRLYMIPLSNFLAFSKAHYNLLFTNLDDIRYMHKRIILPAFREIHQDNISKSVGKLFSSICPLLTKYRDFLMNDNASALLSKINNGFVTEPEKQTTILEWIPLPEYALHKFNKVQEEAMLDPSHAQLNLAAYLLLPVQRLPRYKLLLEALVSATDENHPDYTFLFQASQSLAHLLNYLNESKKDHQAQLASLEPLYKLQIPQKGLLSMDLTFAAMHQSGSNSNRKLIQSYSGLVILKYLVNENDGPKAHFLPDALVGAKKSQILLEERGDGVLEYKFKAMGREGAGAAIQKQIETGGSFARFDVFAIQGKKCKITVATDLLAISHTATNVLCGVFPLPLLKPITLIPQTNSSFSSTSSNLHISQAPHPPLAVVKLCFAGEILFVKGSMEELTDFSNAII